VPTRVLQLGPGDFCRLAFQPSGGGDYEVFYGGEVAKGALALPEWHEGDGLLLEVRAWRECDLNRFESVRDAFEKSKRTGADYVENVHHAGNPFSSAAAPFLSRYEGWLHIASAGKYGFLSASQDASFLLVDGKVVVAAPGRHGPMRHAQRGSRSDVQLTAGRYKFEYYHAAGGKEAIMAAAWEVNPPDIKPAPVAIPTDVFHSKTVARAQAGPVTMRAQKLVPDFLIRIDGDVPLPDNDQHLVGVMFRDNSPKALSLGAKVLWEFGDGQTSEKLNPDHVYLRPGVFAVKLSFKRGAAKPAEIVHRIHIEPPRVLVKDKDKEKVKLHTLDDYLPVLQTYDAKTLEPASLRQLVLAYVAKADELRSKHDEKLAEEKAKEEEAAGTAKPDPRKAPKPKKPADDGLLAEAEQWLTRAVEAGKAAFAADSPAKGDEDLVKLAQLVGPMARDEVGDSQLALQIWRGAMQKSAIGDIRAECAVEAADIAINDLLDLKTAKTLLDDAQAKIGGRRTGAAAGKLQRVWGDYYAASGDGKAARKAYLAADEILATQKRFIEQTAWRGAHSRSTEEFIKTNQVGRAAAELRDWQREFPSEKLDGYLTLLYVQYWAAREKYRQAVAQAEQLLTANPDSPYADQVLLEAADCELKAGKKDGALAFLHSLLKNYPGSALTPEVKRLIARIESGQFDDPKRGPRK
jgi:TolA-binding protein